MLRILRTVAQRAGFSLKNNRFLIVRWQLKGGTIQRAPNDNFHNKNLIGGHNPEIYARNLNLGSGPGHLSYFPAEVAHPYAWPTRTHFLILVTSSRSGSSIGLANQNYCFYRRNFEPKWLIRSPGQPELIFLTHIIEVTSIQK